MDALEKAKYRIKIGQLHGIWKAFVNDANKLNANVIMDGPSVVLDELNRIEYKTCFVSAKFISEKKMAHGVDLQIVEVSPGKYARVDYMPDYHNDIAQLTVWKGKL